MFWVVVLPCCTTLLYCLHQVTVHNVGLLPAHNLKMAVNHPGVALSSSCHVITQQQQQQQQPQDVWRALTGMAGGRSFLLLMATCSFFLAQPWVLLNLMNLSCQV